MKPKRKTASDTFYEQNLQSDEIDALMTSDGTHLPVEQMNDLGELQEFASLDALDAGLGDEPAAQSNIGHMREMSANIPPVQALMMRRAPSPSKPPSFSNLVTSEELQSEKEPIRVRETGWWFRKRVIVPPNAFVVHTRLGRAKPVTIGLGKSFRYNPYKDSYLIVPAAMQTIGVVANSITREKQGINILAYLQWQIEDFATAYRRLDFSDSRDPLAIVNAQLREQAEAAIKDKIATMSVDEVLTDKAPVIEELTTRLKEVAEGRAGDSGADGSDDEDGADSSGADASRGEGRGLGIKIVTVQIREALVSSQRLWRDLQAPFRHEKEQSARISELAMRDEIRQKELESRQEAKTSEAHSLVEIEKTKQNKQTEAFQLRMNQEGIRETRRREHDQKKLELEEAAALAEAESRNRRQKAELELMLEKLEREMLLKERQSQAALTDQTRKDALQSAAQTAMLERNRRNKEQELSLEKTMGELRLALDERRAANERIRQQTRNLISEGDLMHRFMEILPQVAAEMPQPDELRVLQTGGDALDGMVNLAARLLAMAEELGLKPRAPKPGPVSSENENENGEKDETA